MANYPPAAGPWGIDGPVVFTIFVEDRYLTPFNQVVDCYVQVDGGAWTLVTSMSGNTSTTWTSPSGRHDIDWHFHSEGNIVTGGSDPPSDMYTADALTYPTAWDPAATSDAWLAYFEMSGFMDVQLTWTMQRDPNPAWSGTVLPDLPSMPGPWTLTGPILNWAKGGNTDRQGWFYYNVNGGPWLQFAYVSSGLVSGVFDVPDGENDYDLYFVSANHIAGIGPSGYGAYPGSWLKLGTGSATETGPNALDQYTVHWAFGSATDEGTVTIAGADGWQVGWIVLS